MQLEPFLERSRCGEGRKESYEVEVGQPRSVYVDVIRAFVLHTFPISNEGIDIWCWGVDVAEQEHIDHEDGIVVEEMLESNLSQVKCNISVVRDAADVFDAVDLIDYFFHGEIPGIIHDFCELHLGDWHMPRLDGRWVFVDREELHVDSVRVICNG